MPLVPGAKPDSKSNTFELLSYCPVAEAFPANCAWAGTGSDSAASAVQITSPEATDRRTLRQEQGRRAAGCSIESPYEPARVMARPTGVMSASACTFRIYL